jgi:hypothetical protein
MRKILTVLSMLVASLALVLGSGGLASAGSDGPQVCNSSPQSACAKFYQDGDVIRVWDTDCDGHAAVAHVWAPDAGIYENLWNTAGCGTYRDHPYGTSMPEGVAVYYQACYGISYSAGTYTRCSTTIGGGRS